MGSKAGRKAKSAAGQYRKQDKKTVGVYERPRKKKKNQWALLLTIIVILAMVLSLVLAGRL